MKVGHTKTICSYRSPHHFNFDSCL